MSNLRRMLLNSKPKYTVLEYLESTGTQYIITDYILKYNSVIDCDWAFADITNVSQGLFGYRYGVSSVGAVYWMGLTNNSPNLFARLGTGGDGLSTIVLTTNTFFNLQVKSDYYLYFNNQKVGNNFIVTDSTPTFGALGLFCINQNGTANFNSRSRLRFFRIFEDGQLVLDLIPVLDASGIPCIYDRVNNKFYYNQGTGEFSYKEWNKTDLTYLQLSTKSYIDTGYIPNQNTSFKIKYEINELNDTELATCPYGTGGSITTTNINGGILRTLDGIISLNRVGWGTGEGSNYDITGYDSLNTIYEDYYDTNIVYINGANVATLPNTSEWTSQQSLTINGRHNSNGIIVFTPSSANYYSAKAFENNINIFNFKPALDENNLCGFYDIITNKIIYDNNNAAKGFIAGNSGEVYQIGNYIESTGIQLIPLPLSGSEARVIITAQENAVTGSSKILVCQNPSGIAGTWYGETSTTEGYWGVGTDTSSYSDIPATTKTTADITFNETQVNAIINGVTYTRNVDSGATLGNWFLFGASEGSYMFTGKLFGAKVYQNNKLILDLLPATRMTDGVVGLYDKINKNFLANSSTGNFIMG